MKVYELMAYRYGGVLDLTVIDIWKRFANTGCCDEVACVKCPFYIKHKCKAKTKRTRVKKLNEEVKQ